MTGKMEKWLETLANIVTVSIGFWGAILLTYICVVAGGISDDIQIGPGEFAILLFLSPILIGLIMWGINTLGCRLAKRRSDQKNP